jgi:hypothetical protein
MSIIALLQQQARLQATIPTDMGLFTPEQIAACLGSPVANVRAQWPLVVAALQEFGIADEAVQIAAAATIGVESGTFLPVREAWWLDRDYGYEWAEGYRQRNFRYFPYYGRGLIQLTWDTNYARAEQELGITGLVDNPDLALEQGNSARILAWYFATHGGAPLIPIAARAGRWTEVRRLVQGGSAGLGNFMNYAFCLQASIHGG